MCLFDRRPRCMHVACVWKHTGHPYIHISSVKGSLESVTGEKLNWPHIYSGKWHHTLQPMNPHDLGHHRLTVNVMGPDLLIHTIDGGMYDGSCSVSIMEALYMLLRSIHPALLLRWYCCCLTFLMVISQVNVSKNILIHTQSPDHTLFSITYLQSHIHCSVVYSVSLRYWLVLERHLCHQNWINIWAKDVTVLVIQCKHTAVICKQRTWW